MDIYCSWQLQLRATVRTSHYLTLGSRCSRSNQRNKQIVSLSKGPKPNAMQEAKQLLFAFWFPWLGRDMLFSNVEISKQYLSNLINIGQLWHIQSYPAARPYLDSFLLAATVQWPNEALSNKIQTIHVTQTTSSPRAESLGLARLMFWQTSLMEVCAIN